MNVFTFVMMAFKMLIVWRLDEVRVFAGNYQRGVRNTLILQY